MKMVMPTRLIQMRWTARTLTKRKTSQHRNRTNQSRISKLNKSTFPFYFKRDPHDLIIYLSNRKKQKQKEQHAQNNGEDIVEDMDLADFEASDDDMSDE
jgi:hypothetical protein